MILIQVWEALDGEMNQPLVSFFHFDFFLDAALKLCFSSKADLIENMFISCACVVVRYADCDYLSGLSD